MPEEDEWPDVNEHDYWQEEDGSWWECAVYIDGKKKKKPIVPPIPPLPPVGTPPHIYPPIPPMPPLPPT